MHPHPPSGGLRDQLTTDDTTRALLPSGRVIGDRPDLLDFSDLSMLYAGMIANDQKELAQWFKVTVAPDASQSARRAWARRPPLVNWLEHLTIVRNICAHHGRLWNRQLTPLGVPLRIHHLPVFSEVVATFDPTRPDAHQIERVFGTICVISYLLESVEPGNKWRKSIDKLVDTSFSRRPSPQCCRDGIPQPLNLDANFASGPTSSVRLFSAPHRRHPQATAATRCRP
ncbi:Abi family protein [Nocardia farcinica]|uniref:Abi family protein n=1 Tax=Nocardia farcinica TaxID=37329 RepID=UPI003CC7CA3A